MGLRLRASSIPTGALSCAPRPWNEVREVYEIRLLPEPVAMRKAANRITLAELEQAWSVQREMVNTEDVGTWVLLNRRFHSTLITATASPRLAEIIGGLEDAATSQIALSIKADSRRMHDGNKEHEEMLRAFEQHDEESLSSWSSSTSPRQ